MIKFRPSSRVEVDHLHAVLAQPVGAALERPRLADHDGADPELAHEPAAVPARRERRDHDRVPVGAPPAGVPEGLGLPVRRRIAALDAPVVTAPEQRPGGVEQRRADRDSALREPGPRLLDRDLQQCFVICVAIRCEVLALGGVARRRSETSQFRAMRRERSVVIVPSRTIDKFHEPAAETQAYEERLLCLPLMLRDPGAAGRLRHLLAGRRADRRLLPVAAAAEIATTPARG